MYEPLIFIHSWIRWAVVFGFLLVLWRSLNGWIRKSNWTGPDGHLVWAFEQVFGYQTLFGLTLYLGVSPLTKVSFANWGEAMNNPLLKFWAVYHVAIMISAFVIFQIGKNIAYKRLPVEKRHRAVFITTLISAGTACCGIPWAFLDYGRPWFRGFW